MTEDEIWQIRIFLYNALSETMYIPDKNIGRMLLGYKSELIRSDSGPAVSELVMADNNKALTA